MGSFSIWHWILVFGIGLFGAAAITLLVWVVRRASTRPGAGQRPPPTD